MRVRVVLAVLIVVVVAAVFVGVDRFGDDEDGPADSSDSVTFAVVGDFGTGSEDTWQVAESVRQWVDDHAAAALVTTGDNVYQDGAPDQFAEAWEEPYGWVQEDGLRVVATLGNHDVRTDDGGPVMGLLGMPAPWYKTRLGAADVFVLDANQPEDPDQVAWLRTELDRSTARWKIALFHQPAFTCGRYGSNPGVVEDWVPLFEEYDVDLVLNGHDHNYQRFEPRNGVTYVVSGNGGASLYEIDGCAGDEPPLVASNDDGHGFLGVTVTPRDLRLSSELDDGEVVDTVELRA